MRLVWVCGFASSTGACETGGQAGDESHSSLLCHIPSFAQDGTQQPLSCGCAPAGTAPSSHRFPDLLLPVHRLRRADLHGLWGGALHLSLLPTGSSKQPRARQAQGDAWSLPRAFTRNSPLSFGARVPSLESASLAVAVTGGAGYVRSRIIPRGGCCSSLLARSASRTGGAGTPSRYGTFPPDSPASRRGAITGARCGLSVGKAASAGPSRTTPSMPLRAGALPLAPAGAAGWAARGSVK